MQKLLVYPLGTTAACSQAAAFLEKAGLQLIDHPSPEVTHLLLDIPSFQADGSLRGGGDLGYHLSMLPENLQIIGGNLIHPKLAAYSCLDLLNNEGYLAQNAAITAYCALTIAAEQLDIVFADCPVLIIGWGRIGKCLAQMLKNLGAQVTVAARKTQDLAMLQALGYQTITTGAWSAALANFRLILNTVPEMVVTRADMASCKNCVKIELASRDGMDGEDVILARGLPGIHAPESSGKLIAQTILHSLGGN